MNTVKDTNGFIKAASPVVKLFADGSAETNEESQGVTVTRLAVGEYLIEGCMGLNADASWGALMVVSIFRPTGISNPVSGLTTESILTAQF